MIRRIYNINRCRMGPVRALAAAIWDAIADGVLAVIETLLEKWNERRNRNPPAEGNRTY